MESRLPNGANGDASRGESASTDGQRRPGGTPGAGAAAPPRAPIQAGDFARFKDALARRRSLDADAAAAVRATPPAQLYSLAKAFGITQWELLEEVGVFLGLPCQETVGQLDFEGRGLSVPFCRARLMLPTRDGRDLGFALSNPFDMDCIDALTRTLGSAALDKVCLVLPGLIHSRLDSTDADTSRQVDMTRMAELAQTMDTEAEAAIDIEVDIESADQLTRTSALPPVVQAVNMIIGNAVKAGASDIHLESQESDLLVRFRVDGVLADAFVLPHAIRSSVISRLKVIGRLDIAERRRPQDGRARARFGGTRVDLRISTLPAQFGEKIVIRLLNTSGDPIALSELSLAPENLAALQRALSAPQGLVIVTGPTGSGKSTTLYAALNHLKSPTKNVITIENPIEFQISGVTQVQVEPKSGVTFATVLRSVLRQDPNVIMVGEVRDQETAQIAAVAALTGHLMLTTLHTNDAVSSITRLLDLGVEAYQLTSSLSAVLAQRLVRRLCPICAATAPPPVDALQRLGRSIAQFPGGTWRAARGCPECRNTGYRGRLAVHEVLEANEEVRQLITAHAPDRDIREAAERLGMVSMLDDGLAKAAAGLSTLDEILRVVPHATDGGRKAASVSAPEAEAAVHAAPAPAAAVTPAPVVEPEAAPAFPIPLAPLPVAASPLETVSAPAPAPAPPETVIPVEVRKSILVIEDDWSMQALVRLCLTRGGFDVKVVADGIEALLALGGQRFDLIVSDINMPNMDGLSLLQFVKQKGIRTPVVFLSAESEERERECLALGAASFIRKPFTLSVLLELVQQALTTAEAGPHVD